MAMLWFTLYYDYMVSVTRWETLVKEVSFSHRQDKTTDKNWPENHLATDKIRLLIKTDLRII